MIDEHDSRRPSLAEILSGAGAWRGITEPRWARLLRRDGGRGVSAKNHAEFPGTSAMELLDLFGRVSPENQQRVVRMVRRFIELCPDPAGDGKEASPDVPDICLRLVRPPG